MSLKKEREKFTSLTGRQKLQYIWDYYKFPIAVGCIILYIFGYILYGQITKKEMILHTAMINVSAGEELTQKLTEDFLTEAGIDPRKNEFIFTPGLYLTKDTSDPNIQYTQASQVKLLANIDAQKLDIVIMNQEVFDTFAENDYLYDLSELLSENENAEAYHAITKKSPMGLDLTVSGIVAEAGFQDTVYLGVIKNSPRLDMAKTYIDYLFS